MAGGGMLTHLSGGSIAAGIASGLAIGILPLLILGATVKLMQAWCPERPPCICGKCQSDDYDFLGPMHQSEDDAYYYQCPHCHREYRSQGSRFDLKTENGYTPYMKISRWQRWTINS